MSRTFTKIILLYLHDYLQYNMEGESSTSQVLITTGPGYETK